MQPVEQIRHPPSGKLLPPVTHGGHIRALKRTPKMHRPRVGAAPSIYCAASVALGHVHLVNAAHSGKGADTPGETARENCYFALLSAVGLAGFFILPQNVEFVFVKYCRRLAAVDVPTARKHIQHILRRPVQRQPRVYASFDRRPIVHHKAAPFRCCDGWAQHSFQHIGNTFAKLRHDVVPPHHRLAD